MPAPGTTRQRLVAVAAEGVASGSPLNIGSKLLQGWLSASGVSLELIGVIPQLAALPYGFKVLWAPLLDRWPLGWPDRRRGWMLLLQLALAAVLLVLAVVAGLLAPGPGVLQLATLLALVLATASATQDIVVDAYRTDLLPDGERGQGAAVHNLGYRTGMLLVSSGGFLLAGSFGWWAAFAGSALLMLAVVPFTMKAPRLPPLEHPPTSLRQAIVGPAREFLRRTGAGTAPWLLLLVLLYRWPDGLLAALSIAFLKQAGFSDAQIGLLDGGWAIAATMAGTVVGGVLFARLGLNRSLWVFAVIGAAGNLGYAALARFGGGLPALMAAVSLENLGNGMVGAGFVALLMSLCNPRFSATQYALLSSIYAISRTLLALPSGWLAARIGWSDYFVVTALSSLPAFVLMLRLVPWNGTGCRGAFDPSRDAT
ncbi:MAG: MFS transporter [Cyanobacteria bacterium REEB417]|nr:MFS transporter [Cyanobacteria bacterium REEB417]